MANIDRISVSENYRLALQIRLTRLLQHIVRDRGAGKCEGEVSLLKHELICVREKARLKTSPVRLIIV
jgi:hypothetical protein